MVSLLLQQKFENMEKSSARGGTGRVSSTLGRRASGRSGRSGAGKQAEGECGIPALSAGGFGAAPGERRASLLAKQEEGADSGRNGSVNDSVLDLQSQPAAGKGAGGGIAGRYAKLVPELRKKDISNMVPDERDELTEQSEALTIGWVHAFLEEINRIDTFFVTKQD